MKKMLAIGALLFCGLLAVQCKSTKSTTVNGTSLYDTEWKLVSLQGETIDTAALKRRPTLYFNKADLRVHGNGGCNALGGSYAVTGDKLHFSPLISTKMACPGMQVEDKMFKALDQVTSYNVAGGQLLLKSNSGTVAVFATR